VDGARRPLRRGARLEEIGQIGLKPALVVIVTNTATKTKMTAERNLSKAVKTLGKFLLKIPFGKIRIFHDLRPNAAWSSYF